LRELAVFATALEGVDETPQVGATALWHALADPYGAAVCRVATYST